MPVPAATVKTKAPVQYKQQVDHEIQVVVRYIEMICDPTTTNEAREVKFILSYEQKCNAWSEFVNFWKIFLDKRKAYTIS